MSSILIVFGLGNKGILPPFNAKAVRDELGRLRTTYSQQVDCLYKQRRQNQCNRTQKFDQDVQRRSRRVLERIADCVANN